DTVYDLIDDTWDKTKHQKVSTFRNYIKENDIEEAFVIGFDYWRYLRTTGYDRGLTDPVTDFCFRKYGNSKLTEILEEFGIERDMIVRDVLHYVPGVLEALQKKKLLEPALRRVLAPFYESEAVTAILDA